MSKESKAENVNKSKADDFYKLFWKLSNPADETRLQASREIIEKLSTKQKEYENNKDTDAEIWCSDVKYALGRLFQGLASDRKASRLGFVCVLTQLLSKLPVSNIKDVVDIMNNHLKTTSDNDKTEEKGILVGRVFGFLAIIQSCKLDEKTIDMMFKRFSRSMKQKSYLKAVCYHAITELMKKVSNEMFDKIMWPELSSMLSVGWEGCDADLLLLLRSCCEYQSETCGKTFLKTNNWIGQKSKKVELIGSHSYKYLGKMILATTSCHPRIHPLCYEVAERVVKDDFDTFKKFWKEAVDGGLLESTPERKYLALKLAVHSFSLLNESQVLVVWSTKLVMTLFYALSNKTNPLHHVSKGELTNELSDKMRAEAVTSEKQLALLFQLFKSPAGLFLDENTHTGIVHAVVGSLKLSALESYIKWLKHLFLTGEINREDIKEFSLEASRRWSMAQLSSLIRNPHIPKQDSWMSDVIQFMFLHYHFNVSHVPNSEENEVPQSFVPVSDKTREHMKHCIEPAMNALSNILVTNTKTLEKRSKLHGLTEDGELWICKLINYAQSIYAMPNAQPLIAMDDDTQSSWDMMLEDIQHITDIEAKDSTREAEGTALRLLLVHLGIRLMNPAKEEASNTREVLSELHNVIQERFSDQEDSAVQGTKNTDEEVEGWVEVIVETILSMLSLNSHSIRAVADQVFKLLIPHLNGKGLQLILDVLDPDRKKDVLKSKDDGFGEDDEEEDADMLEEDEVNEDSDDSAFDDEELSEGKVENEDGDFRKKVKEALGDAAESSEDEADGNLNQNGHDKSDSDPEMDDEAMMRIDSMLSEVFRQKKMTKNKLAQDNEKQLLIFQLRCLDLIEILANRKHGIDEGSSEVDSLILVTVRPLLVSIQHASKNASDMTFAEKASVLLRVKICKMKKYPRNLQQEAITRCHNDLEVMMAIAQKAHSVFMCQLASDCCLFLLRVLCGNKPSDNDCHDETCNTGAVDVSSVIKIYKGGLENFMTRRESRLQPCVIQDFIARFPMLAAGLAPDLLRFVKEGVQMYRRSCACQMLLKLVQSPAGRDDRASLFYSIVGTVNELIEAAVKSPSELKTKSFVIVMRLYHHVMQTLQSNGKMKSLNQGPLLSSLRSLVEMPEVAKSQELTTWSWKVLHIFGQRREGELSKRQTKKRKKTTSETENDKSQIKEDGSDNDTETKKGKNLTESKKEIRKKVLQEKKERNKESKKKKGKESKKQVDGQDSQQGGNVDAKSGTLKNKKQKKKSKVAA